MVSTPLGRPCYTPVATHGKPGRTYYYFVDAELGLIHVRVQTWFPFAMQVYVNGHEWLARKLDRHGVRYLKLDNVFLRIEDPERAQAFADRFTSVDWVSKLHGYAQQVNPLLADVLAPMEYYWVTAQSEYSTDILFKSRRHLADLAPRLMEHSVLYFGARDVMTFLGRKLTGNFQGEIVADLAERQVPGRLPGCRVKHRMKVNWIKMYDKAGSVLRVETVINDPQEFRVRRRVHRAGRTVMAWAPLRKSVAYLFRYREVSLGANSRYLTALANVDDPTPALRALDAITTRKVTPRGAAFRPFNPLARPDRELFDALLHGRYALRGFANRDLRNSLEGSSFALAADPARRSPQVTRLLRRLHAYGLVAKIPHSRRWRVSASGHRLMSAALRLREVEFPKSHAAAAG